IFFFPAVAAAAWLGGLRPGIFATLLSSAAAAWAFIEPVGRLNVAGTADFVALASFAGSSAVILAAVESMHRSRRHLVEARDLLSTTLDSIGDGVIVTDTEGRVTSLNPTAERL